MKKPKFLALVTLLLVIFSVNPSASQAGQPNENPPGIVSSSPFFSIGGSLGRGEPEEDSVETVVVSEVVARAGTFTTEGGEPGQVVGSFPLRTIPALKFIKDGVEQAVEIGSWRSTTINFTLPANLPSGTYNVSVTQGDQTAVGNGLLTVVEATVDETEETEPAPVVSFRPYLGPIVRPNMEIEVSPGDRVEISGHRMNVITKITMAGEEVAFETVDSSKISLTVPKNEKGVVSLALAWENGNEDGVYRVSNAISILDRTETDSISQKVNAGSFKGYVAVYALGHEGSRLSAKIGKDWVVIPEIPARDNNLFRVTDFTGAGVDIQVRIYIDRVLMETIPLTTK